MPDLRQFTSVFKGHILKSFAARECRRRDRLHVLRDRHAYEVFAAMERIVRDTGQILRERHTAESYAAIKRFGTDTHPLRNCYAYARSRRTSEGSFSDPPYSNAGDLRWDHHLSLRCTFCDCSAVKINLIISVLYHRRCPHGGR